MNKARLEWVMSGLNQYSLTTAEDHFLKTVLAGFEKNQAADRTSGRKARKPLQGEVKIDTQ